MVRSPQRLRMQAGRREGPGTRPPYPVGLGRRVLPAQPPEGPPVPGPRDRDAVGLARALPCLGSCPCPPHSCEERLGASTSAPSDSPPTHTCTRTRAPAQSRHLPGSALPLPTTDPQAFSLLLLPHRSSLLPGLSWGSRSRRMQRPHSPSSGVLRARSHCSCCPGVGGGVRLLLAPTAQWEGAFFPAFPLVSVFSVSL